MSSVLKALKNQSSPLVQGSSEVRLHSAKVTNSGTPRMLLWLVVVALAGALGWWTMRGVTSEHVEAAANIDAVEPNQQRPSVDVQKQYQLGDIAVIKTPQWPVITTPKDNLESSTSHQANASDEQVAQSTRQQPSNEQPDNPSPVNDNQAIDLSQISPELLNAFESALAEGEQGGSADNLNRSVVPTLEQLAPVFKRSIPSFSYDGHQYSSRPQGRWIELSGVRLFEGERFEGLTVLTIAPAHVVFVKDNQAFSQPALEDWTKP